MTDLITCRGGHKAPGVAVCRHLEAADKVVKAPLLPGEEVSDCFCEECFSKGPRRLTVDDIRIVCLICLNISLRDKKVRIASPGEMVQHGFWEGGGAW